MPRQRAACRRGTSGLHAGVRGPAPRRHPARPLLKVTGHRKANGELKTMMNKYLLRRTPRAGAYRPTAIDLFSGAGGITLGLVNAGFDVLLGSDINGACGLTHQKNFSRIPFWQT